jgi:peptide/nickel transport system substrate-binding protein
MHRRGFLAGLAGSLAVPSIGSAQGTRVLKFVPRTGLALLDPVWTTETVTRAFGVMIWESLYSVDEQLTPRPQMAEGEVVDQDGRRWTIRLRDGLRFHDSEPVLARDCIASIERWMKRDAVGRTIADRLGELSAPDDRTIVFRLKKPFPRLAFALGKAQPNLLPIMPARLAATDPSKQVSEIIGSGPFRFEAKEFAPGSFAAMSRFAGYAPRADAPTGTAGARLVHFDRVEWQVIPDGATAAAALSRGEVDWIETPIPDLVPNLRRNKNLTVDLFDPYGIYALLRLNHLQPPTDNVGIRQAIMAAIDPGELMFAVTGGDAKAYTAPVGCFLPGSPSDNKAGMERLGGKKSPSEIREMLRQAGYKGERVVLLDPADTPAHAMFQIIAARLSAAGVNVDDVVTDQATVIQRRNNRGPVEKGGWSGLIALAPAADHLDPLVALGLRTGPAAWIGWPNDPKIEELRDSWLDTADPAEQKRLAAAIQEQALTDVLYVPLGRFFQPSAWRKDVTGVLKSTVPVFWNVRRQS